jgi:hypothetical protein
LGEEKDGVSRAIVFIFRTGATSYNCQSANCKVLYPTVTEVAQQDGTSSVKWTLTGSEVWERSINSVSPNLQKCESARTLVFSGSKSYFDWFNAAISQPIETNVAYAEWKPVYKRLDVDIPSEDCRLLDDFVEKAILADKMDDYRH